MANPTTQVFAVQDRSGTAAQLTLGNATPYPIEVGDTGTYAGLNWEGNAVVLDFTVGAVNDDLNICITTIEPDGAAGNFMASAWPKTGDLKWLTGENIGLSPAETPVVDMNVANAYCTPDFLASYNASRGTFVYPASPVDAVQQALVQAADYIDQRYRFKGIKLFQWLANPSIDPLIAFVDPWLGWDGFLGGGPGNNFGGLYTPSSTFQHTEWPRVGVTDYNGDNVYSIPLVIQQAACELALRALNGVYLQPDYDPTIVTQGGVVSSVTQQVGPIRTSTAYNTTLGLGFFPDFPHVKRMLTKAGLLVGGGGRSLIR